MRSSILRLRWQPPRICFHIGGRQHSICLSASIVVRALLRVYPQDLMRNKILISVLVLLLSGINSSATLICAASCMLSTQARGIKVHHHEMGSHPKAMRASQYTHHHGAPCAECSNAANSLNHTSHCISSSEIQALSEGAFALRAPTGVARVLANKATHGFDLGFDSQPSFLFDSISRSSGPPLLPLRI
jgi:hypothetical protein